MKQFESIRNEKRKLLWSYCYGHISHESPPTVVQDSIASSRGLKLNFFLHSKAGHGLTGQNLSGLALISLFRLTFSHFFKRTYYDENAVFVE